MKKYSKIVEQEFKQLNENHYLEPSDLSEVKYYYSEGFSDGFFNTCQIMESMGYSLEDILSLVKKFDPKGESFAYEYYTDRQEELLESA